MQYFLLDLSVWKMNVSTRMLTHWLNCRDKFSAIQWSRRAVGIGGRAGGSRAGGSRARSTRSTRSDQPVATLADH